jgi:acetylglutamate/LysW-gamma-L-alpha-aminoadipate kinase
MVIKCGNRSAVDPAAVCADVADLTRAGRTIIVVHGGSADIERLGGRLGVRMRRLTSPDGMSARYTDADTLEVVTLAMAGAVQPRIVVALHTAGVTAVGLTGLDGGLLRARRRTVQRTLFRGRQLVVRGDHSGRITGVNTDLLHCLTGAGVVPVICPPALAEDAAAVNADADRVAAAIASAMNAATLVLLTGAPGVLADPADSRSVMATCEVSREGPPPQLGGGMGVKLMAARDALAAGVPQVLIADGRTTQPLHRALSGHATRVTLAAPTEAYPAQAALSEAGMSGAALSGAALSGAALSEAALSEAAL